MQVIPLSEGYATGLENPIDSCPEKEHLTLVEEAVTTSFDRLRQNPHKPRKFFLVLRKHAEITDGKPLGVSLSVFREEENQRFAGKPVNGAEANRFLLSCPWARIEG